MFNSYIAVDFADRQNQIFIIDTENKKVALIDVDKLKELPISYELGKKSGTQAFVDRDNKCRGIFQVFKNRLYLIWVPEEMFQTDKYRDNVYVNNDNIKVVDDLSVIMDKEWVSGVKQLCTLNLTYRQIKKNEFMESYIKCTDKHIEVKEEHVLEVDTVYSFEGETEVTINPSDYMNELLLKMVKANDSISISKEYISKIKVYMKKSLEANLDYTKYKSLVVIKFEDKSDFSILAVLEYDEEQPYTRVNILKPYSKKSVKDTDINDYYNNYTKWRKEKNMRW